MCFLLRCLLAAAAPSFSQQAPAALRPPAGERELLVAHAQGDQIYTCKSTADRYLWTLKQPDAKLFDDSGQPLGRHYAGPTWEWNDHSAVTGKLIASSPSADPRSLPWLLLSAVNHSGTGALAHVLSIQRLNTRGGVAPLIGCDAPHVGAETRVHYTADYHFFGPSE